MYTLLHGAGGSLVVSSGKCFQDLEAKGFGSLGCIFCEILSLFETGSKKDGRIPTGEMKRPSREPWNCPSVGMLQVGGGVSAVFVGLALNPGETLVGVAEFIV